MFERREQEGAETALGPIDGAKEVWAQQIGEERLREVLPFLGRIAAAPDEGIERIPVRRAERFERAPGFALGAISRGEHDVPLRGCKSLTHSEPALAGR